MDLVPLAWLGVLHWRGKKRDTAWWWIAGAFAVSWISDTAAQYMGASDRWLPSLVYPVSQAGMIGMVFLNRVWSERIVVVLVAVAVAAAFVNDPKLPDVLLRTVAWGTVAGVAWGVAMPGRLRASLLVSFGVALLCWIAFIASWGTQGQLASSTFVAAWTYHLTRAIGLALFCWATMRAVPHLRMAVVE